MMEITEYSAAGKTTRTLTAAELKTRAATGDRPALRELLRLDWPTLTTAQKLDRLLEVL